MRTIRARSNKQIVRILRITIKILGKYEQPLIIGTYFSILYTKMNNQKALRRMKIMFSLRKYMVSVILYMFVVLSTRFFPVVP